MGEISMDILNEIKNRRSCRSYQDTIPKKEEINKVIEAGLYAASGMNLQTGIIVSIVYTRK
jgi:nitroreductase